MFSFFLVFQQSSVVKTRITTIVAQPAQQHVILVSPTIASSIVSKVVNAKQDFVRPAAVVFARNSVDVHKMDDITRFYNFLRHN